MFNLFWRIISWFATFGMFIGGIFTGANNNDLISTYKKNVDSVALYCNEFEYAVPQTEIYDMISEHFDSALPEGKTVKKAIVIGYDGCRADALSLINAEKVSAINTLAEEGGTVALSYCGGVNYPRINKQATSTAPGWCSMLTGEWADVHGVTDNSIPKSNDHLTLLTTLVEDGTAEDSAFYVSWGGHFSSDDATYINEKHYIEEKGLDVNFLRAGDDNGTYANVMNDIKSADCSDFIFSIFEFCDHAGHGSSFCIRNSEYETAFYDAEAAGTDIINAIKARETFAEEDWLIIITSDHGGYNSGHGGPTMQERFTFIASNKPFTVAE